METNAERHSVFREPGVGLDQDILLRQLTVLSDVNRRVLVSLVDIHDGWLHGFRDDIETDERSL